jgi:hypothetical protein
MNKQIVKLNRNLQVIALMALVAGTMLGLFVYHANKNSDEPVSGMRVTFEMYRAQSEVLDTITFQVLPILIGLFFLTGFVIFYYLRRRNQLDKEQAN